MPIYGATFTFDLPEGADAIEFGDSFDSATESLTASEHIYSLDASLAGPSMTVLLGVTVPEDVDDVQVFFSTVIAEHFTPALHTLHVEEVLQDVTARQLAAA